MEIRLANRNGEYFLQYRRNTYKNTAPKWKFWVIELEKVCGEWVDVPVVYLDNIDAEDVKYDS